MRLHMKHMAAALIGLCVLLSSGAAVAATPQEGKARAEVQTHDRQDKQSPGAESLEQDPGNRASLLSLILVGGVMVVAVKLAVAFAKKKMEEDIRIAQAKADSEKQQNGSRTDG